MAFTGVPIGEALDSAVIALTAAGVDTPRLDAEILLAHALGVDRGRLRIDSDRPVEGAAVRAFQTAVRRRGVGREPVAYITGTRGFRHIDLQVDPRVLIPRPATETLVEAAVTALPHGARVVDVGTGSGAVALALKDERPDLDVVATDVSPGAAAVARANADRLGLAVAVIEGDLLAGLTDVDAVVSNPPYVERDARLEPELGHEPDLALFGGDDGLEVLRRLAAATAHVPWVAVEVGSGQAAAVADLLTTAGANSLDRSYGGRGSSRPATTTHRDLAGIERVVVSSRS